MDNRINEGLAERVFSACGCERSEGGADKGCAEAHAWGLTGYPLGMVYAPIQEFDCLYDLDEALEAGTIFKELDLPFMGRSVGKGGSCHG